MKKMSWMMVLLLVLAGGIANAATIPNPHPQVATRLVFRSRPWNAVVNAEIGPGMEVEVLDQWGQRMRSGWIPVMVSLEPLSNYGILNGETQVSAWEGHAVFHGLSVNRPGHGYWLVASSPGLFSARSWPFDIRPRPVARQGYNVTRGQGVGRPPGCRFEGMRPWPLRSHRIASDDRIM